MKTSVAICLGLFVALSDARGALYNGNGNTSFGGAVGTGSLALTDDGTTVSGTFTRGTGGSGTFLDVLVIFIDSKSGGSSTTGGFTDGSTRLTRAISGIDGSGNRATADFASGFNADYAIALRPRSAADPGSLFQLANNGAFVLVSSANLSPTATDTSSTYTFSFNLSDIGVTGGQGTAIRFESSYITDTGFRSLESFESLSGNTGWDTVTFTTYDTYITAVPETTKLALGIFGGIVAGFAVIGRARRRLRGKGPRIH